MKTFDFSEYIERYIAGEMSDPQKKWFEKELEGNIILQNEVNLRKRTDEILENQNIISLRSKLSAIEIRRKAEIQYKRRETHIQYEGKDMNIQYEKKEADIQYERKDTSIRYRSFQRQVYLKYAAVIALVVLIGSVALFPGKNLSNDDIISKYYKVYEPPTTQRSAQSESDADFTMALKFYNSHDFGKAAVLFNKVVERNPKDMQSELLSGVAKFGDKKYTEAKQSYVRVINDNNNYFIENAKWYLALCYVQTNEKDKAIQQLTEIRNEKGIYSSDARKIIRRFK
jgi:TolA-binding protein